MKKVSVTVTIEVKVDDPSDNTEVFEATREELESLAQADEDELIPYMEWEIPEDEDEENES